MIDRRAVQRATVWRLARLQVLLGCLAGLALWPAGGWSWWFAASLGGVAQGALGMLMAARMAAAPNDPGRMLTAFYRAELGKWLWAALVFGLAARFASPWFMPLLAGYAAGVIGNWLALRWTPEVAPRPPGKRIRTETQD